MTRVLLWRRKKEKAVWEFLGRLEQVRVGGGEVQGGASCPAGHILHLGEENREGSWKCDLCGLSKSKTVAAWTCGEDRRWGRGGACDYDVCSACMDSYQVGHRGNAVVT